MTKQSNIPPNLIAQIAPRAAELISAGGQPAPNIEEEFAAMWGEIADELRQIDD